MRARPLELDLEDKQLLKTKYQPMGNIDTEHELYDDQSDMLASLNIDPNMSDHDMLMHHVAQHDHELYALDCCLSEILNV